MATKPLRFFEHSPPIRDGGDESLSTDEAIRLERFNRKIKQRERLKKDVLAINYDAQGKPTIRASSYVGVIKVGNRVVEIRPKIGKDQSFESATTNLLYMLNFTKKLRIKELDVAPLLEKGTELIEWLISQFAQEALNTIPRNPCKQYITIENNLPFLKGKIQFREHVRRNSIIKGRFYAQYDEFSEDNLLNQTLKYTTYLLANVCKNTRNLKNLEQILSLLTDVSFKIITIDDLERIHLTRLNHEYELLLSLCKLFISRSSVELSIGKIEIFSLIFDMDKLFEEFIGEFIRREFSECYEVIRLQGPIKRFVNKKISNGRDMGSKFNLIPDIVLYKRFEDETPQLLIDTKYKKLLKKEGKEPIDPSDLYQMYAYSKRYRCPNCVLLYPKWGAFEERVNYKIDDDAQVRIHTVDLNRDLRLERHELKQELASILECPD